MFANYEVQEQWFCKGELHKMEYVSSKSALVLHLKRYSVVVLHNSN